MDHHSFTSTSLPDDYKKSIRLMKKALREQLPDVEGLFSRVSKLIESRIDAAKADEARYGSAWPIVNWTDISEGKVTQEALQKIKLRGCLVVRQNFKRDDALAWDKSTIEYLNANHFDDVYKGPIDNFFGSLAASRPEIYPIYWSQAQMQARQSPRMAKVQSFLNRLWKYESGGVNWFDPDTDIFYPDRYRRRFPGTTSKGLGAHVDSGALEKWLVPAYQKVFQKIFTGQIDSYDPWDAAYRTQVDEYDYPHTKCSAFRTFQGWTALSDIEAGQGLLHVVPVPEAIAYILLRPLLKDVPEDELCGIVPGQVLPISEEWHPHLIKGLSSIPALQAGDTVWWHCDLIHSVAPVVDQKGWGNVMYIPAAPMCPKNLAYARTVVEALKEGKSPDDFPKEDYESGWIGRFTEKDLNSIGRRSLGLESL